MNKKRINIIYSHWHLRHNKFLFCVNHLVFKWYRSPNCKLAIILFSFSVYPFAHDTEFLKYRNVNKYCKSSSHISSTAPIAEWVRVTRWKSRDAMLVVRILPWTRIFCNVHLFSVPRSWTGSVQMKSSMTFIRGNRCIEREKDTFKSREVNV